MAKRKWAYLRGIFSMVDYLAMRPQVSSSDWPRALAQTPIAAPRWIRDLATDYAGGGIAFSRRGGMGSVRRSGSKKDAVSASKSKNATERRSAADEASSSPRENHAARAKGGKSIIAARSTAAKGKVSRIVPRLDGPVTTPRIDTHYIVTEFGAVNLKGLSSRERAHALIRLSHPDFRDELTEAARNLHLI